MRYLLTSFLCVFTLSLTAQVDCPNTYDGDGNGAIGISDLLGLLALFGDADTDSDGVWDSEDDCIDVTACFRLLVNVSASVSHIHPIPSLSVK